MDDFGTHCPCSHASPVTHCESAVQDVGHDSIAPLQRYVQVALVADVPTGAAVHVPGVTSQLAQTPVQTVPQHTPFAQIPELQCCAAPTQAPPFAMRGVHLPASQKSPVTQSESDAHEDGHAAAAPLHLYGLQLGTPALPAGSSVQSPSKPVMLQCWQFPPLHAALQQ